MNTHKGYYSLIQYCPDLGRLEAANVGVLLFCPELQFLKARIARNNRRIITFFGSAGHDRARLNAFKKGMEERLQTEGHDIRTLRDLELFIAKRANMLQITPPRPMTVTDPDKELEALFVEITGESIRRTSTKGLRRQLEDTISKAGLERKVLHNIPIEVPINKKTLDVPIGFQNGRFNLINPVKFEAVNPEQAFATACKYAVEGRSLFEHRHPKFGDLQLVVVGKFRPKDKVSPVIVRKVLEDHAVKMYPFSKLPDLVDDIRRTAKNIDCLKN